MSNDQSNNVEIARLMRGYKEIEQKLNKLINKTDQLRNVIEQLHKELSINNAKQINIIRRISHRAN